MAVNFKANNQKAGSIDPAGPTFIGYLAGNVNTSILSTGFGYQALYTNTSGEYNSAFGAQSLQYNTTGRNNTAIGYSSLNINTTGNNNTASGVQSLYSNTTGNENTGSGNYSLYFNTTGNSNVASGYQSLYSNTTGNENAAIGVNSLVYNTTGSNNTAIGTNSLSYNTTGVRNTASGYASLRSNTTGVNNTANGYTSLYSNTTGNYNTASGYASLYSNTEGTNNTANGFQSLLYNTTGSNNTAIGFYSLYSNTTGSNNTANGYGSLVSNTTGSYNTASGLESLRSSTTGVNNTASGFLSLYSNTSGNNNTANGFYSLYYNTTASSNTATGLASLYRNTTGNYNTAMGDSALNTNTSGSYNTALGYNARANVGTYTNVTAIGHDALATASNQVVLGNTSVTTTLLNGNVGIGTAAPVEKLTISGGNLSITNVNTIATSQGIIKFSSPTYLSRYGGIQGRTPSGAADQIELGFFTSGNSGVPGERMTISKEGNVGIGTTAPNADASLDISSTNKGFLLPRLALTSTSSVSPLTAHVAGMMVYNTATTNDVSPGYYYNDGTKWIMGAYGPFVTLPLLGAATISNITLTSATGNSSLVSNGGAAVISRGIVYATTSTPTISNIVVIDAGTGIGNFSDNLTGLTANTTYYVRAFATNSIGTGYGTESSFKTVVIPTMSATTAATSITSVSTVTGGNIISNGGSAITASGVALGTTSNPDTLGLHTNDNATSGTFTSNIANLSGATLYYGEFY